MFNSCFDTQNIRYYQMIYLILVMIQSGRNGLLRLIDYHSLCIMSTQHDLFTYIPCDVLAICTGMSDVKTRIKKEPFLLIVSSN